MTTKLIHLWRVFLIVICLCFIGGCGSPYKSVNLVPADLFKEKSRNAVNSNSLSWQTQQALRLMFLDEAYRKDHKQVISAIEDMVRVNPLPELRMALAELCLLEAQSGETAPHESIVYYVVAAKQSYDYIFFDFRSLSSSPLQPSFRFMADIYNLAVSELISLRAKMPDKWDSKDFDYQGVHYHFEVVRQGDGVWDPEWFDYLYNSYEIRVTGLKNAYVTRGLGAPLVGIVNAPSQNPHFGKFYPPKLGAYPVSAVLLFDPIEQGEKPSRNIRLVFYDSLETKSIPIEDRIVPLEADFTTPLGLQLQKTKPFLQGLHNLIKSDIEVESAGIYLLEPYRPEKIPIVMVHGLLSSPATWADMFNDLRGDPILREKYQFWFFRYPTGLPIGYSSLILREQLSAMHDKYDPESTNPNFNQMVVIGHSMGGLLTRSLVQDSDNKFWDFYFNEPFDTIDLAPETKQFVKKLAFFEHLPYVKRVVFISTPHRGSPLADEWYTGMLSGMIGLPSILSDTTSQMLNSDKLTKSATEAYTKKSINSLTLLSPSSLFIQATNTVPLRSDIPYHSIVGTRLPVAVGQGTSDGIVPYESSHLDFTESEKLVPSGHGAHTHPLAITEVKRILYKHLEAIR